MSKLSLRIFINTSFFKSFWSPDFEVKSKWILSLNPKLKNPKYSRTNKLITKYSRLEFQHNRFRLLNGEIISKMPLWNIYSYIYCLRKFQNDQVTTMISYAKYKSIHGFWKVLHFRGRFHLLPEASICMDKKILANSRLFPKLPWQCIFNF